MLVFHIWRMKRLARCRLCECPATIPASRAFAPRKFQKRSSRRFWCFGPATGITATNFTPQGGDEPVNVFATPGGARPSIHRLGQSRATLVSRPWEIPGPGPRVDPRRTPSAVALRAAPGLPTPSVSVTRQVQRAEDLYVEQPGAIRSTGRCGSSRGTDAQGGPRDWCGR